MLQNFKVLRDEHLASIEELAVYLRRFVPPDLGHMGSIDEAFALSSLAKVLGTLKGYILLIREGMEEESVILARTIVEVAINCLWVQKNEELHHRRIAALVVLEEEAKVKRTEEFLRFASSHEVPDDIDIAAKRQLASEKQAQIVELEKQLGQLYGYNQAFKKKVRSFTMKEKVTELKISAHYADVFTSACDSVHSGTAGLGMYTKKTEFGWEGYETAFPYDVYNIDAVYTLLVELAVHVSEVYPLFKGSTFLEVIEHHKIRRSELLDRAPGLAT